MRVATVTMIGAMIAIGTMPATAQVRTVDPNRAGGMAATRPIEQDPSPARPEQDDAEPAAQPIPAPPPPASTPPSRSDASTTERQASNASANGTYQENDVLAAAEGVFGKGAEGLAKIIERTFKNQGHPTGYIVGREVGGAIAIGVRYGSGSLFHKVEGERAVYWTGPSLGFDLGANGAKTFVLVYNLYDSQELFKRFPAVEGSAYVVGGFTASYLRSGDTVLIPIRLGVGWRLGANVGYMRFSEKKRWSPF